MPRFATSTLPRVATRFALAVCVAAVIVVGIACTPSGVVPFTERFAFPGALAVLPAYNADGTVDMGGDFPTTPNANLLYVVSMNYDIGLRGGQVQAVDLALLDQLIVADLAKGDTAVGARKLPPEIVGPFNAAIIPESRIEIGSFGGDMAVTPAPAGSVAAANGAGYVGYVAIRESNRLTPIAISPDGRKMTCLIGGGERCGLDESFPTGADDPFGVRILNVPTVTAPEGSPTLFVTHLRRGEVNAYPLNIMANGDPVQAIATLRQISTSAFGASDTVFSPETGLLYVPTRVGARRINANQRLNLIATIDPVAALADVPFTNSDDYIDVSAVIGGLGMRGTTISPDGKTLFVVNQSPDAILAIDISLRPGGLGPRNRVVAQAAVGTGPSRISLLDLPGDEDLLYVPCTSSDNVYVLKTPKLEVVQVLSEIGNGPYDAKVYKRAPFDGAVTPNGNNRDLWVAISNFEEETVVFLEVDPVTLIHTPRARVGVIRTSKAVVSQ